MGNDIFTTDAAGIETAKAVRHTTTVFVIIKCLLTAFPLFQSHVHECNSA
ncbi:MAG: hypothetical protein KKH67_07550 [candidate division Zixibacteria bacterium]|nr:hypothetical protein [candidate division Zixibacteria bacterium]MBU1470351.1 hypothetical protein [candidate division Zixibacteria bacterium]